MTRLRTVRALAAIAGLALLLAGCAGSNAALRNSREVGRAFEVFHAYPDYRYWYLNQENNPYAVVGLEKGYGIQDQMWTLVDPNSKTFEKVVGPRAELPGARRRHLRRLHHRPGGPDDRGVVLEHGRRHPGRPRDQPGLDLRPARRGPTTAGGTARAWGSASGPAAGAAGRASGSGWGSRAPVGNRFRLGGAT